MHLWNRCPVLFYWIWIHLYSRHTHHNHIPIAGDGACLYQSQSHILSHSDWVHFESFFCVCETTDSIAQKKREREENRRTPRNVEHVKTVGKKALEPPSLAEPPPPRWRHAFYANSAGLDDDDACCCTVKGLQPEDGIERPTSLVEGSTLSPNSVLHRKSNGSVEFEASRKNFVKLWWLVIGK